ncbi:MAG: 4-aminobutyrate aminotransferase/4-aminobutyrate aminotransferase/(S)-3-amino-2-methylpropionate [Pedosphaera sp.]|nr:4-aminobutyrate aminotransferase/4-aminobutyrate aminotransferase/(S)-3-amino-2-methylpropionate [Pedosphaera sp.]
MRVNKTKQILNQLRNYESRNVTFTESDGSWPIVWERARGANVWDAEDKKYLDLTAAFGVAAAGHANPRVVKAGQKQMNKLLHAMGDVHPHALKAQLARELSRLTFERWTRKKSKGATGKTIFCNSGFEAVEAALKTALLATSKPGVISFEKGYHGLGYGALNATHRDHFRWPFRAQLSDFGHFVEFPSASKRLPEVETAIRQLMKRREIGAILVEPIQARGGINVPPPKFLPLLRRLCNEHGALLILDEIYTGFGRTGRWFACEHSETIPDLICLGKAMAGGFPISACVGRADIMDAAWPVSSGEAIHTSTFLGHPVGCAMALAQIEEIRKQKLVERSAQLGNYLMKLLQSNISNPQFEISIRGAGLMVGLELCLSGGIPATIVSLRVIKEMLHRGFILLPEGAHGNVISFTPPLTITKSQLAATVNALQNLLGYRKTS